MRKKYCRVTSLGIFMSLLALSSCVDNGYDLDKNIDMTITIGGSEFAVPGGYTGKWKLGQVLDIDTSGIIKIETNGNYILKKKGDDSNPSLINVDKVTVDAPEIQEIDIDLDFQKAASAPKAVRAAADSMVVVIPTNKKTSFSMKNETMPVELLSLSYVDIKDMKMTLTVTGPAKLSLRDMVITFPDYMDIQGVINGKYRLPFDAVTNSNGIYKKELSIQGMRITDNYYPNRRLLELNGDLLVSGKFWISKADYNASGSGIPQQVVVAMNMNDMVVETVTGKVNPKIDIHVSPVKLTDIPDFLNDDEVRLDLDNPMILLKIVNESPVDVNAIGKLVAKKNGKIIKDNVYTGNLSIKGGTNNLICLSRTGVGNVPGYTNVRIAELSALLEKIPDEILFTVDAHSDINKEFKMRLGYEYEVLPSYELNAPLAFGANTSIVYNDTIDGWNSDLKDIQVRKVLLNSDVYNSIPLDVTLTAVPIDLSGNPLDGIKTTVDKMIPAGSGDLDAGGAFQASMTSVVITMEEVVPGAIGKLDGIRIKANASVSKGADGKNSTVGKNLNENQYLQLTQIKLKVPGGIKVDLN